MINLFLHDILHFTRVVNYVTCTRTSTARVYFAATTTVFIPALLTEHRKKERKMQVTTIKILIKYDL